MPHQWILNNCLQADRDSEGFSWYFVQSLNKNLLLLLTETDDLLGERKPVARCKIMCMALQEDKVRCYRLVTAFVIYEVLGTVEVDNSLSNLVKLV